MTGNDYECEKIKRMELADLLEYILAWPEYLTDSYYREFKELL